MWLEAMLMRVPTLNPLRRKLPVPVQLSSATRSSRSRMARRTVTLLLLANFSSSALTSLWPSEWAVAA
ncbi:hypothetical protein D9M71_709860 [compost metagenome]